MESIRLDRWLPVVAMLAGGVVVALLSFSGGSIVSGVVFVTAFAALGWWSWPGRRGTHVSHRRAHEAASDDDVIIYWRPGCSYCARLRVGLGRARRQVTWVNIWRDDEAAEFVASHREGNETVPTAVTGSGRVVPATPDAVKAQLALARG